MIGHKVIHEVASAENGQVNHDQNALSPFTCTVQTAPAAGRHFHARMFPTALFQSHKHTHTQVRSVLA